MTGSDSGKLPSSVGKGRSKPAVNGTATLIRTVLPTSRAIKDRISVNIRRETATSAIWKVT